MWPTSIRFIFASLALATICMYITGAEAGQQVASPEKKLNKTEIRPLENKYVTYISAYKKPVVVKGNRTLLIKATAVSNATKLIAKVPANTSSEDHKAESSIFRPYFLRHLLSSPRGYRGRGGQMEQEASREPEQEEQQGGGEEEEEVTRTIVMPIGPGEAESVESAKVASSSRMQQQLLQQLVSKQMVAGGDQLTESVHQMKPEASLQLTSTEMSGILNDREAPEMYRERELAGDGVLVGEERARLGAAASEMGGYGTSGAYFGAGLSGGFAGGPRGGMNEALNQRLLHAASEEANFGGGFQHRFGQSAYGGGGGGELAGGGLDGRLMQSPNEYSEFNAGAHADSFAGGHHGGSLDYAGSGLLRAGSGELSGAGSYDPYLGGMGGAAGLGGYPSSPALEREASELYGSGGLSSGRSNPFAASDLYSGPGRLLSAGSAQGGGYSGEGMGAYGPGAGSDYFASRYGQLGGYGSELRGFASQKSSMIIPQGRSSSRSRLVPISPAVPTADEVGASSNGGADSDKQVHEPLEDDLANEVGEPADSLDQRGDAEPEGESVATTMASALEQFSQQRGPSNPPSLVLNVPPPNTDAQTGVEFLRVGSAGYLAPTISSRSQATDKSESSQRAGLERLLKKTAALYQPNDPSENPAHAGKYIID